MTLNFKISSGLYLGNCKVLEVDSDRDIVLGVGWSVSVQCHGVTLDSDRMQVENRCTVGYFDLDLTFV